MKRSYDVNVQNLIQKIENHPERQALQSDLQPILFRDNTEILEDLQEEQVPQTSTRVVATRSKAKAKPQPRVLVGTTATIPIHERRWIDIEPSKQGLASYDLSKKVINLLRHNQTYSTEKKMEQLYSVESNSIFEIIILKYRIGPMIDGKLVWLQAEDPNEDVSIALIIREQFSTSVRFKDILETISLILRYRTMWRLELEYSLTFTTSDAHSIILLSTMDWYLEVKI